MSKATLGLLNNILNKYIKQQSHHAIIVCFKYSKIKWRMIIGLFTNWGLIGPIFKYLNLILGTNIYFTMKDTLMNVFFQFFFFLIIILGRVLDLHLLFFLAKSTCLFLVKKFQLRCWTFFHQASELGCLDLVQMWLLLKTINWQIGGMCWCSHGIEQS